MLVVLRAGDFSQTCEKTRWATCFEVLGHCLVRSQEQTNGDNTWPLCILCSLSPHLLLLLIRLLFQRLFVTK
uniref:Uncharacterized protein n=1 Tax=Caenorhabditis japonica TaxID=281687 RepID=A0A8R1IN52_CAEJA